MLLQKLQTNFYCVLLRQLGLRRYSSIAFLHSRHADNSSHAAEGKKLFTILFISLTLAGLTCSFPRTPAMFLPSSSLGSNNRFNKRTAKFALDLDIFLIRKSSSCGTWETGTTGPSDEFSGGFESSRGIHHSALELTTASGIPSLACRARWDHLRRKHN